MSRGGARNYPKGTGVRVNFSCRIDPETLKKIEELSEDWGMGKGAVIDNLVKSYAKMENQL